MLLTLQHLFTPHHTNNHRAKILQPAGLVVLVGVFLFTQSFLQLWKAVGVLPGGLVLGYASSISPSSVVEQTNSQRSSLGLEPLTLNSALSAAAVAKANHMLANDYWAHIAPDGTTPWVFIRNAGYGYSVAGENLARDFGDTGSMVNAWMNSATHKANIVNPKYKEIGIAVVDGKLQGVETTLVVQMFGSRGVTTASVPNKGVTTATKLAVKTVEPTPALTPVAVPEVAEPVMGELTQPTTPTLGVNVVNYLISPLMITKTIASSISILLLGVLAYDLYIHSMKKLPRRVGKNWAHMSLFMVVLVIILALTQGKII